MKRIMDNSYLIFPLGAALAMAGLVSWSLVAGDGPSINAPSLVFLVLLPLLAALFSFTKSARARGGWWIVRWLGTTVFGLVASVAVLFASTINAGAVDAGRRVLMRAGYAAVVDFGISSLNMFRARNAAQR
jgi:hypothetical protein